MIIKAMAPSISRETALVFKMINQKQSSQSTVSCVNSECWGNQKKIIKVQ